MFLKCRAVDADGPLVRLMNLLLNKETLMNLAQWVTEYWWAVLLFGISFLIFMGLFIKCCAVHTPSSNPKKPPARRLSETLRRPMNTLRRMVLENVFVWDSAVIYLPFAAASSRAYARVINGGACESQQNGPVFTAIC